MRLNPGQLAQHLAKSLLPIYVVSGDEPLLVEESLDLIRAAARRNGYTERDVFDVERGFNWGQVIEACASMSLFASRRIIEVRMPKGPGAARGKAAADEGGDEDDAPSGKGSMDGAKILVELAQRPSEDTLLIAACGPLDYKQRQAQWYLALESAGASVHAEDIAPEAWPGWVEARLRAAGLTADPDAVRALAERTEGNALAAKQDIEKLKLLYPSGSIDADAVRDVVADSARYGAFDLAERMLAGDVAGTARAVAHLRAEGAEPVQILAAVTWTIRQWAQVQTRVDGGADPESACGAAFIPRARIPLFVRALRRTPRAAAVYGWLRQAATIDQLSKSTGGKEQAWEELLTLVLAAAGRRVMRPLAASAS
jgi:DNA polymerase-3 subunit delta